ncbi:MAG: PilN domain-containing protein [Microgenomates group bacterium]
MENIDFLQEFKKKEKIKEKYSPFIKKGFLFFAFLYLLTVFTVFFFFLYYNQESKKVSFLIEEKKNRIKQLEKRESLQVLIKQRISFLSKIINSRKIDFVNKVAYLASLEEKNNIIFKKIEFKENGVVLVSGTTSDVKIFRNFLKNLENDSYFDQIDVDSIKRGKDGSYDFSLSLGKNEEKK